MEPTRLNIEFEEFENQILSFQNNADELISKYYTISADEDIYKVFDTEFTEWVNSVTAYLRKSFNGNTQFAVRFNGSTKPNAVRTQFNNPSLKASHFTTQYKLLKTKSNLLIQELNLIRVCDAISNPMVIDFEQRNKFTVKETEMLLLQKLNDLSSTHAMYNAEDILSGNGIQFTNDQVAELVVMLYEQRLVSKPVANGGGSYSSLTLQGKKFLEEIQHDSDEQPVYTEEMETTFSDIQNYLLRIDIAQEVILAEIIKLRKEAKKQNKESWPTIMKGKAVEWVFNGLLSKEAAGFIYQSLTGENIMPLLS